MQIIIYCLLDSIHSCIFQYNSFQGQWSYKCNGNMFISVKIKEEKKINLINKQIFWPVSMSHFDCNLKNSLVLQLPFNMSNLNSTVFNLNIRSISCILIIYHYNFNFTRGPSNICKFLKKCFTSMISKAIEPLNIEHLKKY